MTAQVAEGVFFTAPRVLPRGRHSLAREQVLAVQRERIMAALVELMAAKGYHGFGLGDIATRAGVSRGAFYDCFKSKEACAFAAYDRFIEVLLQRIAERTALATSWDGFVEGLLGGYLDTLAQDLVVARAFQVEMDAMGPPARRRRRAALGRFAELVRSHQGRLSAVDPSLQPMADEAYLGAVYAARQVASDALDTDDEPDLEALLPALAPWFAESFRASSRVRDPLRLCGRSAAP